MMSRVSVYKPVVVEGYEWVQPVDERDFAKVYQMHEGSLADSWEPVRVKLLQRDENGLPWKAADTPWLGGHALVFRDSVYRVVNDLLGGVGEFLKLNVVENGERLWLYNVVSVVDDALDQSASEIERFRSTGRVMRISKYVFRPSAIKGAVAFKIPESRTMFLSSETAESLRSLTLRGLAFDLVWQEGP